MTDPTLKTLEHRVLGKSGLSTSAIGLGCWQLGGDFGPVNETRVTAILAAADEQNINFWDTADVYGAGASERHLGAWCRAQPRSRIIASKVGRNDELYPTGYQYDAMRRSIEGTLERLQISCLDLLQLHCIPENVLMDEQVWQWLDDFRSEGLVKHYGASIETVSQGLALLDFPHLTSLQIIFNLFRQDAAEDLLPLAQHKGVGIIARLPLASGLLSGKFTPNSAFSTSDHRHYNRDGAAFNVAETFSGLTFEDGLACVEQLKSIITQAELPAVSLSQLALRWCLDHPQVTTVIAGASSAEQVASNAGAAQLPPLEADLTKLLQTFYYDVVKPKVRGFI